MGTGGVGEPNPFDGTLWDKAAKIIPNRPKGLSDQQLLDLVQTATADGVVTAKEERLLQAVADPENVKKIAAALKDKGKVAGFGVNGLNFATPRSLAIGVNINVGLAGQQIHATYDPAAITKRKDIQASALAAKVGPAYGLNMATQAGRDAILDRYGQLMGTEVYGAQACGGAALVALAVNAGPEGLAALARIIKPDWSYDKAFTKLLDSFADPQATFTLADLAALQDAVLDRMKTEENARTSGASVNEGVTEATLQGFITAHEKELAPLFAGGASILPIDNSGDGAMDHYVAYVPKGGKDRVFEPWQTKSGSHLITDPLVMRRYAQATHH